MGDVLAEDISDEFEGAGPGGAGSASPVVLCSSTGRKSAEQEMKRTREEELTAKMAAKDAEIAFLKATLKSLGSAEQVADPDIPELRSVQADEEDVLPPMNQGDEDSETPGLRVLNADCPHCKIDGKTMPCQLLMPAKTSIAYASCNQCNKTFAILVPNARGKFPRPGSARFGFLRPGSARSSRPGSARGVPFRPGSARALWPFPTKVVDPDSPTKTRRRRLFGNLLSDISAFIEGDEDDGSSSSGQTTMEELYKKLGVPDQDSVPHEEWLQILHEKLHALILRDKKWRKAITSSAPELAKALEADTPEEFLRFNKDAEERHRAAELAELAASGMEGYPDRPIGMSAEEEHELNTFIERNSSPSPPPSPAARERLTQDQMSFGE